MIMRMVDVLGDDKCDNILGFIKVIIESKELLMVRRVNVI
jgi:ACT domain-containing protein